MRMRRMECMRNASAGIQSPNKSDIMCRRRAAAAHAVCDWEGGVAACSNALPVRSLAPQRSTPAPVQTVCVTSAWAIPRGSIRAAGWQALAGDLLAPAAHGCLLATCLGVAHDRAAWCIVGEEPRCSTAPHGARAAPPLAAAGRRHAVCAVPACSGSGGSRTRSRARPAPSGIRQAPGRCQARRISARPVRGICAPGHQRGDSGQHRP